MQALTKYFEAQAAEVAQASVAVTADATDTADGEPAGSAHDIEHEQEVSAIRDLLQHRTRNLARYTCRECGFRARLFYWQCPGCNRWETYAPRRSEALG